MRWRLTGRARRSSPLRLPLGLAACAVALAGVSAPLTSGPSYAAGPAAAQVAPGGPTWADLPPLTYVAHRAGPLEARENSASGLASALASGTVQVLDLDAHLLADGTVVVMHDDSVGRVSTAVGPVSGFTAATWSQVVLDVGSWLDPVPAPEPAPTLARVLDRFGGRILMTVEAKDADAVETLDAMIRRRDLVDSVMVNTHDPEVARRIHSLGLRTQLWRNNRDMRTDDPTSFAAYVDVLDVDIKADDADIQRFTASGVPQVWAHTLTTRAERDRAVRLGATGVVTDDPRYVSGVSATFPVTPTVVTVRAAPAPVQVSDRTVVPVLVSGEAGPGLPGVAVAVSGPGASLRSGTTSAAGMVSVRVQVPTASPGWIGLSVSALAGSDAERRWPAGRTTVPVRVRPEDLELRPRLSVHGRRLTARVRLLDSSAAGYRGPRPERGPGATSADVSRAVVLLVVRHQGRVVRRVRATTPGSGPDGRVVLRAVLPGRGAYRITVREAGPTYTAARQLRRVVVRGR